METMPEDEQKEFLFAIYKYCVQGQTSQLSGAPAASFCLIRHSLDNIISKSNNGCRGGRPKKQTESKQESKPKSEQKANVVESQHVIEETTEKKETDIPSPPITPTTIDKERKYIKESIKEISQPEQAYINNYTDRFPRCMGMKKPMTYDEFCRFRSKIINLEHVDTAKANWLISVGMERLENDPKLNKNYISAYLTLNNWYNRGFLSFKNLAQ